MTMHLEGPWLSTTGKRKSKQKFRTAEHAKKARELKDDWNALLKQYGIEQEDRKKARALASKEVYRGPEPYRGFTERTKSTTFTAGPCAKVEPQMYTGDKMIGIGQLHKSNAVPIFSNQEAIEISRMRRG
jgi:hypothetical protein